jgi:hypothetical protein
MEAVRLHGPDAFRSRRKRFALQDNR